jgi:predicted negative regulator of RcsB-dependent stress response
MRALEVRYEADRTVSADRLARAERALDDLYRQREDPALAELRDRLAGLEIDQAEADEALRASALRLKWLAGAVVALSLGLTAAALLLGLG